MHWKTVAEKEYFYRSLDRKGKAKSLGVRSAKTEDIERHFNDQKTQSKARLESLSEALTTHSKINAAHRLGSAPSIVAALCQRLSIAGLLGPSLVIIGTNSLFAYEAMAGVRFDREMLATTDIDLLSGHKARIRLALMDFMPDDQAMEGQTFRAVNDKGFMVDLIRQMPKPPWKDEPDRISAAENSDTDLVATDIWNMKWLLNAPQVQQNAIALNGTMFPICAPDPRAYAMFKLWLSQSDERNPVKKSRDFLQAKALAAMIQEKLPHLAANWNQINSFPAAIAQRLVAQLVAH